MNDRYYTDPSTASYKSNPVSFVFTDDGMVPNNPLPFLLYKNAVPFPNNVPAEEAVEAMFTGNGWGATWRNGIFGYLHYHSTVHEVLGVARGRAQVRFGGDHGEELEVRKGDVAILPAGTGHQCLAASEDFLVVGAYPPGPEMTVERPTLENHRKALKLIPQVEVPTMDPVYGAVGPLVTLWRRSNRA